MGREASRVLRQGPAPQIGKIDAKSGTLQNTPGGRINAICFFLHFNFTLLCFIFFSTYWARCSRSSAGRGLKGIGPQVPPPKCLHTVAVRRSVDFEFKPENCTGTEVRYLPTQSRQISLQWTCITNSSWVSKLVYHGNQQWCGLRQSVLGQDRSQTKKIGLGLERCGLGLGLAGLV